MTAIAVCTRMSIIIRIIMSRHSHERWIITRNFFFQQFQCSLPVFLVLGLSHRLQPTDTNKWQCIMPALNSPNSQTNDTGLVLAPLDNPTHPENWVVSLVNVTAYIKLQRTGRSKISKLLKKRLNRLISIFAFAVLLLATVAAQIELPCGLLRLVTIPTFRQRGMPRPILSQGFSRVRNIIVPHSPQNPAIFLKARGFYKIILILPSVATLPSICGSQDCAITFIFFQPDVSKSVCEIYLKSPRTKITSSTTWELDIRLSTFILCLSLTLIEY